MSLEEDLSARRTSVPSSAVERLAKSIRSSVRTGRLVADQRLVEADLTKSFGVSRSTVREAIRLLVAEGLLTQEPNRSTRVRKMSEVEVIDLTRVRETLEGLAARMAAENIGRTGNKEALRTLFDAMAASIAAADIETYYDQNEQLHALILQMSCNLPLSRLVKQLRISAFRVQFWKVGQTELSKRSHSDHERVIQAILCGNADLAEAEMRRHVGNSVVALKQLHSHDSLSWPPR